MLMLLTITLSIVSLLVINFLLLIFSSNKIIENQNKVKKPVIYRLNPDLDSNNNKKDKETLAATGS